MSADQDKVLDTASSIADGSEVNWEALEAAALSEEERRLLRQLRLLAGIADLHRSVAGEPEPPAAAPAPAPQPAPPAQPAPPTAKSVAKPPPPVAPPEPPARSAERWGHLELVEKVGEGTFGEVYRAHDTRLHRDVALKLLRPEASRTRLVQRVLHEGRTLARIRHLNVVTVYGVEEHDDRVGLWMEFVHGSTLAALLARQGPYSAREAALIGQDLCRALAAVHGAGLVHRDLKAQNVMREHGGRVVLMDFGAGRLLDGAEPSPRARMTGTPMYLAPELVSGESDATVQSDIYAVGVLLYHLVTRAYPVRAMSLDTLRTAHAGGHRTPLHDARHDLPDGFVAVVERALHPDPQLRYQSAGAMQAALATSLGLDIGAPVPLPVPYEHLRTRRAAKAEAPARARPAAPERPAWRPSQGLRAVAAIAVVGLLLLVALALLWQRGWRPAADSPDIPLLVIRPFEAMTGEDRVLASGLTSEIGRQLGMLDAPLSIAPVASVDELPLGTPSQRVLERLGADVLVEGRAGQQGDMLVVSVSLTRAGQDQARPLPELKAPVRESFRLTTDIAERIAAALSAERRRARREARSVNPDAWDAYLRGRYALMPPPSPDRAIQLLQKARNLQPGFAEADAALGQAYLWSRYLAPARQRNALITNAREAATQALAVNPDLAEAYFVLADIAFVEDGNWAEADKQFQRALRLDAAHEVARYRYAMFLASRRRTDEALRVISEGRRLNPLSATIAGYAGMTQYFARHYDRAAEDLNHALSLNSAHAFAHQGLCRVYRAMSRTREALAQCEATLSAKEARFDDPKQLATDREWQSLRSEVAQALVGVGRHSDAQAILADMVGAHQKQEGAVMPESIAFTLMALGRRDEAFKWLDVAMETKSPPILYLAVDPRFDPIREDPRYAALMARLGLE
ncbi:MAG: protein kinase [Luteitalea sp.]|nr:protein kinase [Luteitalea sp.]